MVERFPKLWSRVKAILSTAIGECRSFDRTRCKPIASRLALLGTIAWCAVAGAPAQAELLDYSVPVEVMDVGGVCFLEPDRTEYAPNIQSNELWIYDRPRVFAVHGDVFAARPGLAIEVHIHLGYFKAGKSYSIELDHPDGRLDQWDYVMGADGVVWTGHSVHEKELLPLGTYVFRAFDGQRLLFSYRVTVDGYADGAPCEAQVS